MRRKTPSAIGHTEWDAPNQATEHEIHEPTDPRGLGDHGGAFYSTVPSGDENSGFLGKLIGAIAFLFGNPRR